MALELQPNSEFTPGNLFAADMTAGSTGRGIIGLAHDVRHALTECENDLSVVFGAVSHRSRGESLVAMLKQLQLEMRLPDTR